MLASNRGAPNHLHSYHKLIANPMTTAEIGTDTWEVHARIAGGRQRRMLISAIMAHSPSVAAAVTRASQEIPVVILELLEKREPARLPRPEGAR